MCDRENKSLINSKSGHANVIKSPPVSGVAGV